MAMRAARLGFASKGPAAAKRRELPAHSCKLSSSVSGGGSKNSSSTSALDKRRCGSLSRCDFEAALRCRNRAPAFVAGPVHLPTKSSAQAGHQSDVPAPGRHAIACTTACHSRAIQLTLPPRTCSRSSSSVENLRSQTKHKTGNKGAAVSSTTASSSSAAAPSSTALEPSGRSSGSTSSSTPESTTPSLRHSAFRINFAKPASVDVPSPSPRSQGAEGGGVRDLDLDFGTEQPEGATDGSAATATEATVASATAGGSMMLGSAGGIAESLSLTTPALVANFDAK
mmetsp:Transcript_111116/g.313507  ORF Transcript_111116/g.313507 Transcript_111116/m.313507 type:complete len:284 (-) Transcript_111116:8-859(-)